MLSVSHSRMLRLGHDLKIIILFFKGQKMTSQNKKINTAFKYQKYKTAAKFPVSARLVFDSAYLNC